MTKFVSKYASTVVLKADNTRAVGQQGRDTISRKGWAVNNFNMIAFGEIVQIKSGQFPDPLF